MPTEQGAGGAATSQRIESEVRGQSYFLFCVVFGLDGPSRGAFAAEMNKRSIIARVNRRTGGFKGGARRVIQPATLIDLYLLLVVVPQPQVMLFFIFSSASVRRACNQPLQTRPHLSLFYSIGRVSSRHGPAVVLLPIMCSGPRQPRLAPTYAAPQRGGSVYGV